jgi:hypothetical protein
MRSINSLFNILILLCFYILISGCAARLLGVLAESEVALLARTATLRATSVGLLVESEAAISSTLARARLMRTAAGRSQLYVIENGKKNIFGELVNTRKFKWLESGYEVPLPGRIYEVRKGLASINLRHGPGRNYSVYKTIPENRLVIILEESNGWYKVQLDNDITGWILASALVPASNNKAESDSRNELKKIAKLFTCNFCNGRGRILPECSTCRNRPNGIDCDQCRNGEISCEGCIGRGIQICDSCVENYDLFRKCFSCSNTGILSCAKCYGSGVAYYSPNKTPIKCGKCFGSGILHCTECVRYKNENCTYCDDSGFIICKNCLGKKIKVCSKCNGKGNLNCPDCARKSGTECFHCSGLGKFYVEVNDYNSRSYCSESRFGQYLLYNGNPFPVNILMYKADFDDPIYLYTLYFPPKSAKCVYEQWEGKYKFRVHGIMADSVSEVHIEDGSFSVKSCKTSTYLTKLRTKDFKKFKVN